MRARFTGLKAWWVQRVSAVYMLLFVLFLLGSFALQPLPSMARLDGLTFKTVALTETWEAYRSAYYAMA